MNTGRSWQLATCFLIGVLIVKIWLGEPNTDARAQDVRLAKPSIGVAVVDLARLFKGDPEFTAKSEKLQAELQEFDRAYKASFSKVKEMKERFEPVEARNYFAAYERIVKASRDVCRERGLQLVIRFTADPLPVPGDRKGLEQLLGRPVIFQDDLDITDDVLKRLKGDSAP